MGRPVQYNVKNEGGKAIHVAEAPEGVYRRWVFYHQTERCGGACAGKIPSGRCLLPRPAAALNLWPPWVLIMILARFGAERVGFSPRQCDLLMVMGTIAKKMGPVLRQVYLQMAEPSWVLSMGACACSGGIFDTYSVLQGIDQIIPVDVYIPGCPPRPEAVLDGFMKIQELVGKESIRRRNGEQYKQLMESYGIQ